MATPNWLKTRADLQADQDRALMERALLEGGDMQPDIPKGGLVMRGPNGLYVVDPNQAAGTDEAERPLKFKAKDDDSVEGGPLFTMKNGVITPLPKMPGLKRKEQIINYSEPSEKENPQLTMAKETYKEYVRKIAAGEATTDTFLKQVEAIAPLLSLVKVRNRGEEKTSGWWKKTPTGEFDPGPTIYKPAENVTADEWAVTAQEEILDAMALDKKYSGLSEAEKRKLIGPKAIQDAIFQLRGAGKK